MNDEQGMFFEQKGEEMTVIEQTTQTTKQKATRQRARVLTARDMHVLTWIGEMYTIRFDLLQKLLGNMPGIGSKPQTQEGELSTTSTYKLMQKWRDMGLVEYRKILGDEPLFIWLTTKGLREIGSDYREQTPSLALIKHYHQVTVVRYWVEQRNLNVTWKSERSIRGEVTSFRAEERRNKHTPDGVLIWPDLTRDAIEIELTRKGQGELEDIISGLNRDFEGIYYFVSEATEPHIRELTAPYNTKMAGKFKIVPLAQVLREVNIEL